VIEAYIISKSQCITISGYLSITIALSLARTHLRSGLSRGLLSVVAGSARSRCAAHYGLACTLEAILSICAAGQGIFQIVIGSFLKELSVLQSLNKFKLLTLHSLNHLLMLEAFLLLADHLILDLLFCTHLLFYQLALLLLLSLYLLSLDHLLNGVVLDVLLLLDHMKEIALILLLLLNVFDLFSHLVLLVTARRLHIILHLFLDGTILRLSQHLLLLFLALTLGSLLSDLHIALACLKDIGGALLGFIELFPSLGLFLLEQSNTVRK